MKIAIPTLEGKLCAHFGHCETFSFVEVNSETDFVSKNEEFTGMIDEIGNKPYQIYNTLHSFVLFCYGWLQEG